MKVRLSSIALGCTLFASLTAVAQKPANATGQCKDGSYWTGASSPAPAAATRASRPGTEPREELQRQLPTRARPP